MKLAILTVLLLAPLVALHAAEARPSTRFGLEVRDGVLLREGKPYRGIGVNYFNAFGRVLASPTNTTYRAGFATLHERNITSANERSYMLKAVAEANRRWQQTAGRP